MSRYVRADVPSRGVSAVLTDVQSWPRATRGLSCCAAAAGTGATGVDGQSVTRLSHVTRPRGAVTPGRTGQTVDRSGTFQIFRSRPSTRARRGSR